MRARRLLLSLLMLALAAAAVPYVVASTASCSPARASGSCCCNGGGCPMSEEGPATTLDCSCDKPTAELAIERDERPSVSDRAASDACSSAVPAGAPRRVRDAERPPGIGDAPTWLLHLSILC